MAYWLFKSEPGSYAWADLVREGRTSWDGVRNHQASNNMKAMAKGERGFFYHSGEVRAIVGVVEVARAYYPDHTDASGRFGMVDVTPVKPVPRPVALAEIKAEPKLSDLLLVRNSRLSVVPVGAAHWRVLCRMAGIEA
ncbi:MAG TPA: EVE domain-containing protein [Alphaproteobacteria bacterium]